MYKWAQSLLSDALKQAVVRLIEVEFSTLDYTTNTASDRFVVIQPSWQDFGNVEIVEQDGQLIVDWGRFTHGHIDSYDDDAEEHVAEIVELLRRLLSNALADKIAFWGVSHGGSGGFFFTDYDRSRKQPHPAYLWSGAQFDPSI